LGKLREALAIGLVISGSLQPVAQAMVGDGLSFDPFTFCQDGWPTPEVAVVSRISPGGPASCANAVRVPGAPNNDDECLGHHRSFRFDPPATEHEVSAR
jgi:hypothetical protein